MPRDNTPRVLIRPFEVADAAQVVQIWTQVFGYGEARNDPRRVLEAKLRWDTARGPVNLLVALDGSSLIGTVMIGYDGHRGWLYRLAVSQDSRRCGVGRALVEAAETELRKLGCTKINLQLHAHNESGARFWQALGYGREARISMGKDLHDELTRGTDSGC